MNRILLILSLIALAACKKQSGSAAPESTFFKVYTDSALPVQAPSPKLFFADEMLYIVNDKWGNSYCFYQAASSQGTFDHIMKTDKDGKVIWQKKIDPSIVYYFVPPVSDGNYIYTIPQFLGSVQDSMLQLDTSGTVVNRIYLGMFNQSAYMFSNISGMTTAPDGNLYVWGVCYNGDQSANEVAKISSTGAVIWQSVDSFFSYGGIDPSGVAGNNDVYMAVADSLYVDSVGGYYFSYINYTLNQAGHIINRRTIYGGSVLNGFINNLGTRFVLLSSKIFGNSNGGFTQIFQKSYCAAYGPAATNTIQIYSVDKAGNFVDSNEISLGYNLLMSHVQQKKNGNLLLVATTCKNVNSPYQSYLIEVTPELKVIQIKSIAYGNTSVFASCVSSTGNGYNFITGTVQKPNLENRIFILKTDDNENF